MGIFVNILCNYARNYVISGHTAPYIMGCLDTGSTTSCMDWLRVSYMFDMARDNFISCGLYVGDVESVPFYVWGFLNTNSTLLIRD